MTGQAENRDRTRYVDWLLAKPTEKSRDLAEGSGQRHMTDRILLALRDALLDALLDVPLEDLRRILPLYSCVMEEGTTDAGTMVIEWTVTGAQVCLFVGRKPDESLLVTIDGTAFDGVPLPFTQAMDIKDDDDADVAARHAVLFMLSHALREPVTAWGSWNIGVIGPRWEFRSLLGYHLTCRFPRDMRGEALAYGVCSIKRTG